MRLAKSCFVIVTIGAAATLAPACLAAAAEHGAPGTIKVAPYKPSAASPVAALLASIKHADVLSESMSPGETLVSAPAAALGSATYHLEAGISLQTQLADWCKRAGWKIRWEIGPGWIVPGGGDYGTDFQAAITEVITELAGNGADIVGDGYTRNRVFRIHHKGAN